MSNATLIFRTFAGCVALFLVAGCSALPPQRHAWQVSPADVPALQGSEAWPQLSTNQYARVSEAACSNAVALLQNSTFILLDSSQEASFVPMLPETSGTDMQPYLVRGVCYSSRPYFTIVRFDEITKSLLIQQFTWDGEIATPFRWVEEPNALVVFIPQAPEHVYPDAILGGDWIFRGRKLSELDTR